MEKDTRNRIRNFVHEARGLLESEISELLEGVFGLHPDGTLEDIDRLLDIREDDRAIKAREGFAYFVEREVTAGSSREDAVNKLVLGLTFTHLNRLVALKLMEHRGVIRQTVSRLTRSSAFIRYIVDVLEKTDFSQVDDIQGEYRDFLMYQCEQVADEIKVLFNPEDLSSYVFPGYRVLEQVLGLINDTELESIWDEDETIGWFYQYFTPKELREQARAESSAPRNSWELAFRNQFYTPRYVVQFLADNTLGRTWYEMYQGNTRLTDVCEYMVRPPNEVFLAKGESARGHGKDDYVIPFRKKKDPREIKVLDPACGSGHFLLYVFDLLMVIYKEAWDDPNINSGLMESFTDRETFEREIPRLILENNLHGIDIDLRAIQIAALAVWLRAQREWHAMGLKREDRPRITNAHLVCAEPMPGNKEMFEEFVATLDYRLIKDLVRDVWKQMELAGEAGSLLQIEQDLRTSIAKARKQWEDLPKERQLMLFPFTQPERQLELGLYQIKDEEFFQQAEEKVFDALRRYVRSAAEREGGYSRRLFADESLRGFQFIELLQQRYDVVLMNPPFGLAPKQLDLIIKKHYPDTYVDLYASFVTRGLELASIGKVGAITSRAFLMTKKLTRWRTNELIDSMVVMLDLGSPVMDDAFVEACAFVVSKVTSVPTFFAFDRRFAIEKSPATIISDQQIDDNRCYHVSKERLHALPQAKMLYSLPPSIHLLLNTEVSFEPTAGTAREGMRTFDDSRFLRLRWEVSPARIGKKRTWEPLSKGGEFAIYYSDIHLLVKWNRDGRELAEKNIQVNGQTAQSRQAISFWRQSGATYSKRSVKGFSVRALPQGCIFGTKGPAVLSQSDVPSACIIGWLNSRLIRFLVHIQANAFEFNTGIIKRLPWRNDSRILQMRKQTEEAIELRREVASFSEENSCFAMIPVEETLQGMELAIREKERAALRTQTDICATWDCVVDEVFGVDSSTLDFELEGDTGKEDNTSDEEPSMASDSGHVVLSYAIGLTFVRWDIRMALDQSLIPVLGNPFDPLPVCSPATLLSPDGYPATNGNIASEAWLRARKNVLDVPKGVPNSTIPDDQYPLRINWDGIMVEDEGHEDDIIARLREVFTTLYGDKADERELEILDILKLRGLRDYFRNPKKFFDLHTKRYSKSRRKAPIYWLLQSRKKNYGVWLYYHRLDGDTLHKVVRNYVDPKLNLIDSQIAELKQQAEAAEGREQRRCEKDLESLEDLRLEVQDFKQKLEAVMAVGYNPNFDDGVILNMAPLHELIPWNEPAKYWRDLEKGKYDWAHIAMHYWPDRVKQKCRTDKSLAIAHGLEEDENETG